eukprot:gene17835-biopygen29587
MLYVRYDATGPKLKQGRLPGLSAGDAVAASIRCSYLWRSFEVLTLSKRMRDAGDPEFSHWVDGIGNGELGDAAGPTGDVRMVTMPTFKRRCVDCVQYAFCVEERQEEGDGRYNPGKEAAALEWLAPSGYSGNLNGVDDISDRDIARHGRYWKSRAVLSPHNARVDALNEGFLDDHPGTEHILFSADEIALDHRSVRRGQRRCAGYVDYDGDVRPSGVPPHELRLRIGAVAYIVRNLAPADGLVNGTKVIVKAVHRRTVEVIDLISGVAHSLPRICFKYTQNGTTVVRRQYPLRIAYRGGPRQHG